MVLKSNTVIIIIIIIIIICDIFIAPYSARSFSKALYNSIYNIIIPDSDCFHPAHISTPKGAASLIGSQKL